MALFDDSFDFGSAVSDIWGGVTSTVGDVWSGITGLFGGDEISYGGEGGWPEVGIPLPGGAAEGAGGPDVVLGSDNGVSNGGALVPVGMGGAVAAGGIMLGTLLARTFGRRAAGAAGAALFTAANGVRVRMAQLWPLVRRYGAEAVAGGLGIGLGALGTLLATPEALHGRKRGKRINPMNIRAARRAVRRIKGARKLLRSIERMLPRTQGRRWSGGGGYRGGYRRRSYRARY